MSKPKYSYATNSVIHVNLSVVFDNYNLEPLSKLLFVRLMILSVKNKHREYLIGHKDLANYLGICEENIDRLLDQLEKQNYIEAKTGFILDENSEIDGRKSKITVRW